MKKKKKRTDFTKSKVQSQYNLWSIYYANLFIHKTISLKQMDNKRDPKPLVQFTLYFHFDRFMFHDTWRPARKLAFTRQPFNPPV